jgi:hypothetical protein
MQVANTKSTSQSMSGQTSHQHSRRSRSFYRHDSRIRRYKQLLGGITILFLVIYVFTWLYIVRKTTQYEQTLLELRKQEITLAITSEELGRVKKEKEALVEGRIPGLLPLTYDETISIDNPYIRNIIFTQVKNGKGKTYEYRLVMNNDTLSVIHPQVQILLFSDTGIQIGEATVEFRDLATGTVHPVLDPGEVRSQTAVIKLLRDVEPHYFLLTMSEANPASTERLREQLGDIISH